MNEFAGHPLRGPLLKLGRAKEHFAVLRQECEDFIGDEPWDWRTEYATLEDGLREYTVYASVEWEPPIELGLIAGDVVQNLRAALDQLIWGNSERDKRDRRTAFPIYLTEEDYREYAPPKIRGIQEQGRDFIEQWQPFQLDERAKAHPLAMLQELSNIDKHRTLLPVAVARRNEFVTGYGEWKIEEITYHQPSSAQLLEEALVMTFTTSGEPPDRSTVDPYLTFELAVEGRTLQDFESMILYVGNDILGSFERDFD